MINAWVGVKGSRNGASVSGRPVIGGGGEVQAGWPMYLRVRAARVAASRGIRVLRAGTGYGMSAHPALRAARVAACWAFRTG
ncbi:hypothetical protein GCM10011608_48370 [Micromonospora sonchi]|uniref:Uncharacterized protein n=1 Tax=Micromonospora sonchi TaxID=1763543 RepID=A0A917X2M2_9ACTN|nr:hypothetical protein GCM10011608_48370 [Micromonospora sonchi]